MIIPSIYLVCEKVIRDQEQSGVVSLIGLFDKISVAIPPESPEIPDNAVIPRMWAVFSSWSDTEGSDTVKENTICCQVLYPNKNQFGEIIKLQLKFENKKKAQAIVRFEGFPIGQQGSCTIRTWIEHNGTIIVDPIEIGVEVEFLRQKQNN